MRTITRTTTTTRTITFTMNNNNNNILVLIFLLFFFAIQQQKTYCQNLQTLHSHPCEDVVNGVLKYYACTSEPLHILRPGHINFNVTLQPDITCGVDAREPFCVSRGSTKCYFCDSKTPSESHPITSIYDTKADSTGNTDTFWQSKSWTNYPQQLTTNLTIDLDHLYELQSFTVTFSSSRPKIATLLKSNDFGTTWQPLQFYNIKCPKGQPSTIDINQPDTVICTKEYSYESPFVNGQLQFDIVNDRYKMFLGNDLTDYKRLYEAFDRTSLNSFLSFTNLKLSLVYPATDGKEFLGQERDLLRYFYGVSNMEVMATCQCNLHAKYCKVINDVNMNKKTVCDCKHNTGGDNCEICLPLYNNRPWKSGAYVPYPDGSASECQKCECNDHATSCFYDAQYGRGICNNCTHNTEGKHCEICSNKYFRNQTLPLNHTRVCEPCNCQPLGLLNRLDESCNSNGQCNCKNVVSGLQCDRCQNQYYGLVQFNGTCQPCNCNSLGTKAASNVCHFVSGQCTCKSFTMQRDCSECKNGFYAFPKSIQDDCLDCDCDRGASSSLICNKVTGHCQCRFAIIGRTCNSVNNGYYIPYMDSINGQPIKDGTNCKIDSEIAVNPPKYTGRVFANCQPTQRVTFDTINGIERQALISWPYVLVLRYMTNVSGEANLNVNVLNLDAGINLEFYRNKTNNHTIINACPISPGIYKSFNFNFTSTFNIGSAWISNQFELDARCRYSVVLTLTNQLVADSIVFLPFLNHSIVFIANTTSRQELEDCFMQLSSLKDRPKFRSTTTCIKMEKSIMAEMNDGAIRCECNMTGSLNMNCDGYGGQCLCKNGVMGLNCDRCMPGYFNFTDNGCQACLCDEIGSKNGVCDYVTGQCPCWPNVARVGDKSILKDIDMERTCKSCLALHYGFNSRTGCLHCNCSMDGSTSLQCSNDIGQCPCKNTITGRDCSFCENGYFNFSTNGCNKCDCNMAGSLNTSCAPLTGQCECKANTMGEKCSICKSDSFNLQETNIDGCQKCFCYGHSITCTSAKSYRIESVFINTNVIDNWPRVVVNGRNDFLKTSFNGNYLSAYNNKLKMMASGTNLLYDKEIAWIIGGYNGDEMQLFYKPITPILLTAQAQLIEIHLHHTKWYYNRTNTISSFKFSGILANLTAVYLKFRVDSEPLRIESLQLDKSSLTGTGKESKSVEECQCQPSRNVSGTSCQNCIKGTWRGIGKRNEYSICRVCDCKYPQSFPPLCNQLDGYCLNCRNGTKGKLCNECALNVKNDGVCDTCMDGFFGPFKDGCWPCNCTEIGTENCASNNCKCDSKGKCPCKPNVMGDKCEKCADNYYDLENGCKECGECYKRLQKEVDKLSDNVNNLTDYSGILQSNDNNTLLGAFNNRLSTTVLSMQQLISFLYQAVAIENRISVDFNRLNWTLNSFQRKINGDINMDFIRMDETLNKTKMNFKDIDENQLQILKFNNLTNHVLNTSIYECMANLGYLLHSLKSIESNLKSLSNSATGDLKSTNLIVNEIRSQSNTAKLHSDNLLLVVTLTKSNSVSLTTQLATLTNTIDALTNRIVSHLLSNVKNLQSKINNLERQSITSRSFIENNLAVINTDLKVSENRAAQIQLRAQNLQSLSDRETKLAVSVTKPRVDKAMTESNDLKRQANEKSNSALNIFNRIISNHRISNEALNLSTISFNNARKMVDIMKNFNNKSEEVKLQADKALLKVDAITQTADEAKRLSKNVQGQLTQANTESTTSLQILKNCQVKLNEENTILNETALNDIKNLTNIANQLTPTLKESIDNYTFVNKTSLQASIIKHQFVSKQTQGLVQSVDVSQDTLTNLSNNLSSTKLKLNSLLKRLKTVTQLNSTGLVELDKEVVKLRMQLLDLNLAEVVRQLKSVVEGQEKEIQDMSEREIVVSKRIKQIRDASDQLKRS